MKKKRIIIILALRANQKVSCCQFSQLEKYIGILGKTLAHLTLYNLENDISRLVLVGSNGCVVFKNSQNSKTSSFCWKAVSSDVVNSFNAFREVAEDSHHKDIIFFFDEEFLFSGRHQHTLLPWRSRFGKDLVTIDLTKLNARFDSLSGIFWLSWGKNPIEDAEEIIRNQWKDIMNELVSNHPKAPSVL